MVHTLLLNPGTRPIAWATWQELVVLSCRGMIQQQMGEVVYRVRGGVSRDTGERSLMEVPSIAGAYAGVIGDSARTMKGQWVQGGRRLPLALERTREAPTVRRPQEPRVPYPYESETVTFRNDEADVTLRGTLTYPADARGPVPGVVLVAVSRE